MEAERRFLRRRLDIVVAAAFGAAGAGVLCVLKLASEVADGRTAAIDRGVLVWLRTHWGEVPGLRSAMLDLTALGDMVTLSLIALVVAGWLALQGRAWSALFLLAQISTGSALVHAIKPWFGRARPEVVPHWGPYSGLSFPSGHSADAAIVYLSLAVIAGRATSGRAMRLYLALVACVLTLLVGLSRMYLGVHWPSDVVAGWATGAAWAALCGSIENRMPSSRPVSALAR